MTKRRKPNYKTNKRVNYGKGCGVHWKGKQFDSAKLQHIFRFIKEDETTEVTVFADKNNQICDIQPRIGDLHTHFQGRPLNLALPELKEAIKKSIQ